MIEPFTVGCRAARRGLPKSGEKAVVFGAGTIGISAAISLKFFGCKQVVICDYSDFRLNICKQLGFDIYNNKSDSELQGLKDILGENIGDFGKNGETYGLCRDFFRENLRITSKTARQTARPRVIRL